MKGNPIVHFEIYVRDLEAAKNFYEKVFDFQLQKTPSPIPEIEIEMWSFPMGDDPMNSYGAGGMLVKMEGFEPGGGGTIVYFGCEDCAVQLAKVVELGGSVFQEKTPIGEHGFCALIKDTEGNTIGLHSMR